MKRVLSVAFILFLSLGLSASYYVSNELGQKKGNASSYDSAEWVLDERGNTEILYHSGVKYFEKTTTSSGWTKTTPDGEERVYLNSDGNIERRITEKDSSREEYNYIYSGTLLKGYNFSLDGELLYKVEYTTTSDGILLYYREKDEGVYITDEWFVFENGERMEVGSFKAESIISNATEDGGYEETENGVTRRYDANGRLVSEKSDSIDITYTYSEDGRVEEKRENRSDGVYVTTYENEGEVLSRYSQGGVKISERRALSDGTIEERRFVDGKAKYVFIYDSDGKRIKEAYAL